MNKSTTTRDTIIETATYLFNKNGASNVSLRMIADEMGISVGNLTYHFHKKEDLISEIVVRLTKERNIYGYPTYVSMSDFNEFLFCLQSRHERFSFFYADLANLTRQYQVVHDAEIRANSELKFFYNQVLRTFEIQGLINPERYKNQYGDIADVMVMVSTFWSQEKIVSANFPQKPNSLVSMIWSVVIPCCTAVGIKEFNEKVRPSLTEE